MRQCRYATLQAAAVRAGERLAADSGQRTKPEQEQQALPGGWGLR